MNNLVPGNPVNEVVGAHPLLRECHPHLQVWPRGRAVTRAAKGFLFLQRRHMMSDHRATDGVPSQ